MTISQHLTTFAGMRVVEFKPGVADELDAAGSGRDTVAWRLSADYDSGSDEFTALFEQFLDVVGGGAVRALIIGQWGEAYESGPPIDLLVRSAPRLPQLRALFLGEMTFEECEISWIKQGDVTRVLDAFPALETLRVRGADGLELTPVKHGTLRQLAFESGGLPAAVVRAVGECDLPALERLELWLGTDEYGGDATVDDLAAILSGNRLPALRALGLRDAEIVDLVAAALASAPVVARLAELDLSMGILSDTGAEALLAGQPLTHLRRLDLSHHFMTPEMVRRLHDELPGVDVDTSDEQEADEDGDRYVAVAE